MTTIADQTLIGHYITGYFFNHGLARVYGVKPVWYVYLNAAQTVPVMHLLCVIPAGFWEVTDRVELFKRFGLYERHWVRDPKQFISRLDMEIKAVQNDFKLRRLEECGPPEFEPPGHNID